MLDQVGNGDLVTLHGNPVAGMRKIVWMISLLKRSNATCQIWQRRQWKRKHKTRFSNWINASWLYSNLAYTSSMHAGTIEAIPTLNPSVKNIHQFIFIYLHPILKSSSLNRSLWQSVWSKLAVISWRNFGLKAWYRRHA